MVSKDLILVASDDPKIREMAREAASKEGLNSVLCGDGQEAVQSAKKHASDSSNLKLVVLEAFLPKVDGFEVVNKLQEFEETKGIPVLMFIGQATLEPSPFHSGSIQPQKLPTKIRLRADNYLQKPFELAEIKGEIHSMVKHYRMHQAPHPVTGLPGHPAIEQEMFNRLNRGEVFSMLWMDINHFRPFNDHYGTDRGDDVLKMLARMLEQVLASEGLNSPASFLAHVDGDDFILLLPPEKVDALKLILRERFQNDALPFYPKAEAKKGFFYGKGRDQKDQIFPLMNLSMIVLTVKLETFMHYGQLVSQANDLMRQAKLGAENIRSQ